MRHPLLRHVVFLASAWMLLMLTETELSAQHGGALACGWNRFTLFNSCGVETSLGNCVDNNQANHDAMASGCSEAYCPSTCSTCNTGADCRNYTSSDYMGAAVGTWFDNCPSGQAKFNCICDCRIPAPPSCDCDSDGNCCDAYCGSWTGSSCEYGSPILINLAAHGLNDHLTSAADGVVFDIMADGVPRRIGWPDAAFDVAFLALDRNGNGTIDSAAELFGNHTRKRDGTLARNGFDALLDLDAGPGIGDGDGKITASDPIYSQLRLWIDRNHNGYSEPNELSTLQEHGIETIYTAYSQTRHRDKYGNRYQFEGTVLVLRQNGQEIRRRVFDVAFAMAP